MQWTEAQAQAISYGEAGAFLVAAAAGSGKTAVLTERLLERALAGAFTWPEVVVVTFTDKAARQLRLRLEKKLREALQAAEQGRLATRLPLVDEQGKALPQNLLAARLRKLLLELPLAHIQTMHSFCLDLIRKAGELWQDEAGQPWLEPGFRVLDPGEAELLLQRALSEVFEVRYRRLACLDQGAVTAAGAESLGLNPADAAIAATEAAALRAFRELTLCLSPNYDDRRARASVMQIYRQLRALPDYLQQLAASLATWQQLDAQKLTETGGVRMLLERAAEARKKAGAALREIAAHPYFDLLQREKKLSAEGAQLLASWPGCEAALRAFCSLTTVSWADYEALRAALPENLPLLSRTKAPKTAKAEQKESLARALEEGILPLHQMLYGSLKPEQAAYKRVGLEAYPCCFARSLTDIAEDLAGASELLAAFTALMTETDRRFSELKREAGALDYGDFEHGALQILRTQAAQAEREKTHFLELYIDEYQDTSPLQEAILTALNCPRTFLVGDLKQSIYRFRNANPQIFSSKMEAYEILTRDLNVAEADPVSGRVLFLSQNFRSHPELLLAINSIFASLMTREQAELSYDEHQQLLPGREETPGQGPRLSLLRVVRSSEDAANEAEIRQLLAEIRRRHAAGWRYGDMAILARTNSLCATYLQALQAAEIPVVGGRQSVSLDTAEIRLLENLLKILLNPLDDLALASLLLSPLGQGFSEEDLLKLTLAELPVETYRERDGGLYFWRRFQLYAEIGPEGALRERVRTFREQLASWRRFAENHSVRALLEEVIEAAAWRDALAFSPQAEERRAALDQALQLLANLEERRQGGLAEILEQLRQGRERGLSLADFNQAPASSQAVRVMTMHASKGLEFPLVFVPGLGKNLQLEERSASQDPLKQSSPFIRWTPEEGLTALSRTKERQLFENPLSYGQRQAERQRSQAEAYRLLYVAMTRAEEELVLLAEGTAAWSEREEKLILDLAATERRRAELAELSLPNGEKLALYACPPQIAAGLNSYWLLLLAWLGLAWPEAVEALRSEQACAMTGLAGLVNFVLAVPDDWTEAESEEEMGAEAVSEVANELAAEAAGEAEAVGEVVLEAAAECPDSVEFAEKGDEGLSADPEQVALWTSLLRPDPTPPEVFLAPAKITVSELTAAANERQAEAPAALLPSGLRDMQLTVDWPDDEPAQTSASGRSFGSLVHRFFQLVDLQVLASASDLESGLREEGLRLERVQFFQAEEAALLREQSLLFVAFFESNLGQRLLKAVREGRAVYRELPFTLSLPALGLPQESGEWTLVQGMVDLFFVEDGQAVVIDYKTDRLRGSQAERDAEAIRRYREQLDAYALALERGLHMPCQERVLWLWRERRGIRLPQA